MRCAYEAAMAGVPLDVRAKDNPALIGRIGKFGRGTSNAPVSR